MRNQLEEILKDPQGYGPAVVRAMSPEFEKAEATIRERDFVETVAQKLDITLGNTPASHQTMRLKRIEASYDRTLLRA